MIFQHLFLTKVIRPVRSLRLFLLQGYARVLGGGPVASSRDDQSCDREDSDKGGGEHPDVDRHPVGESGQIPVHNPPGQRHRYDEADQHDPRELHVEHLQDLTYRGTVDAPYTDFLAAVLGLEHHEPEDSHQRDDDREQGEEGDEA